MYFTRISLGSIFVRVVRGKSLLYEGREKYIYRISKDITQKVIQAMEIGFKKYLK
jgi:hypothetical protein